MKKFLFKSVYLLFYLLYGIISPAKAQLNDTVIEKKLRVKEMKCVGVGLTENNKEYTDTFLLMNRKYTKKGLLVEELSYYSEMFDVSDPNSFIAANKRRYEDRTTTFCSYDKSRRMIKRKTINTSESETEEEIRQFDKKGKLIFESNTITVLKIKKGELVKSVHENFYRHIYLNEALSYTTNKKGDTVLILKSDQKNKTECRINTKRKNLNKIKFDLQTDMMLEDRFFEIEKGDTIESRVTLYTYVSTPDGIKNEKQIIINPIKHDTLIAQHYTYNKKGQVTKNVQRNYDFKGKLQTYTQYWEYDLLNRLTKHTWEKEPDFSMSYFPDKTIIIHYGDNMTIWKKETRIYNKDGLISERIFENKEGQTLDHFYFSYTYFR